MIEGDVFMPMTRLVMVIKTPKKEKEQKTHITFCIVRTVYVIFGVFVLINALRALMIQK